MRVGCSIFYAILDYTSWQQGKAGWMQASWPAPSCGLLGKGKCRCRSGPARLSGAQRDSVEGALRACVAADETLAEGHQELRARGVGAAQRNRLVRMKKELSIVR